ncbi:hypothetical protein [Desulfovibrio litoralis]|uniref:Uncharacterized protein n=1 Tax=Desulfovibrio litoralis DSM 11393 TaxID=1121455 RepID=A0A1M7TLE9_9BACT|nr:hypothetical protein [Desulfovibrio litoralis]SHN71569.1 hypothetical protein SAMN02745728_02209 [Desulfovibrio litoralis DSM 11393]
MSKISCLTLKEYSGIALQAKHHINLIGMDPAAAFINILGTMLFPDIKQKRMAWIIRMFLYTRGQKHEEEFDTSNEKGLLDASKEIGNDFAELAFMFGGPAEINKILFSTQHNNIEIEGQNRISNGVIIGKVFLEMLDNKLSLQEATNIIFENDKPNLTKSTIAKVLWPQFMPIVHYWAALNIFYQHNGLSFDDVTIKDPDEMLSCLRLKLLGKKDGVEGLIRLAESYQFRGIATVPRRKGHKHPILDITKMFFIIHPFLEESKIARIF